MSLRVTFLGTGGSMPTTERAPSAVSLHRDGEAVLFDCGEGTQRQMMRYGTGFGHAHLLVTHLHGDHVLGIPGLVQTLGFNERTAPLAIHGPPGTAADLDELVHATGHEPEFPVEIRTARPGEVVVDGDGYDIRAFRTDHRTTSVGYAFVEDDRPGRFDRQKAEEDLEIPPGPAYGRLHAGETVELDDGRVIEPDQVVGPPRPGRRVVYTGDTRPTEATVDAATGADLLVHDGTFAESEAERARHTGHSTASEAAEVATRADAGQLALTHVSSRYAGDPEPLVREARAAFDGEAFVAADGESREIPFPDADED